MQVGELPVRALSALATRKTAYKLSVTNGLVLMAVDGYPRVVK